MIGTTLTRRRDLARFKVTGRDGGAWVLTPVEFGTTIAVSNLELDSLYDVEGEVMPTPNVDPQRGWDALAERHAEAEVVGARKARSGRSTTPEALTAEENFAARELSAEQIARSPRHLRALLGQSLAVSAETANEVQKLIATKSAAEIVADDVLRWAARDGRIDLPKRKATEVAGLLAA